MPVVPYGLPWSLPFRQPGYHAAPVPQISAFAPSPLWSQRVPPLLAQWAGPLLSCCPIPRSQKYLWHLMVRFCLEQHLLVPPDPLPLLVASRCLILAPVVFPFAPSHILPRCLRFCPGVLRALARHAAAHRSVRGLPVLPRIRALDAAVFRPQFVCQLAASFLLPLAPPFPEGTLTSCASRTCFFCTPDGLSSAPGFARTTPAIGSVCF
mmetsp:Transcript_73982/g.203680  ORF Transcript_73982/g.203680 Transcript_73982/m.203680 type:complete len:209 (+) Transcript_73982:1253-1879(+)